MPVRARPKLVLVLVLVLGSKGLYIRDPPEVVSEGSSVALYADDCKAFRVVTCPKDLLMFQDDLDSFVHLDSTEQDDLQC